VTVNRRGVFNTEAFAAAVETKRESLGISGREVARQAGLVEAVAVTNLRRGVVPSAETLARLLLWLGDTDLARFINQGSCR
jgi:transcriptional regulator with XRE-family HTH domain